MKILGGIGFLLISAFSLLIYVAGNHGQLMFRPHMTEDWVIWGIAVICGFLGVSLIYNGIVKRQK